MAEWRARRSDLAAAYLVFQGAISASQCSITAASGRRMNTNAQVELRADGTLKYRESVQLEDGGYAFRVPTSQPYRFVRIL